MATIIAEQWKPVWWTVDSTPGSESVDFAGAVTVGGAVTEVAARGTDGSWYVTAAYPLSVGETVTFTIVNDGANQPLAVSVAGSVVTVHLATDGGGTATSTAGQVQAALAASAPASAVLSALYLYNRKRQPSLTTVVVTGETVASGGEYVDALGRVQSLGRYADSLALVDVYGDPEYLCDAVSVVNRGPAAMVSWWGIGIPEGALSMPLNPDATGDHFGAVESYGWDIRETGNPSGGAFLGRASFVGVVGDNAYVCGDRPSASAYGDNAHVCGDQANAYAYGDNAQVYGDRPNAFASGDNAYVCGDQPYADASGDNAQVYGDRPYASASGDNAQVYGDRPILNTSFPATVKTAFSAEFLGDTTNEVFADASGRPIISVGYIEANEITDPAAPTVNNARLYTRDNGSGKTQLCVRFATGAIQVISTEP